MNNNLLLTESVGSAARLDMPERAASAADKKNEQISKNFEGLFLNKIVEQVNNSIAEFSEDEDGQGEQVRSMFSMFLSEHIANNGGLGLWKKIYEQLSENSAKDTKAEKVDNVI